MEKQVRAHGLWPSPVSPNFVGQQKRLDNPRFDSNGSLLWVEGRAERGVLVMRQGRAAPTELNEEQSVRGGIGYGGGEYDVCSGRLVFAEKSGRLFSRRLEGGLPSPITPAFGAAASPAISPDGRWVAYVWSDGKVDCLAVVDSEGRDWPLKLASGADFYMQPAWHPQGELLAWVEWDHPNMPWDSARLKLGRLSGTPPRLEWQKVLDGDGGAVALQPQFSADGHWLSYIASRGEFEDLVLLDLQSGQTRVLVHGDGFHLCDPAWVQGMRSYAWHPGGQHVYYLRNYGGMYTLWQVDLQTGISSQVDTHPYTWLSALSVSETGEVALVASAPSIPDRVVRWDGSQWHVEARSSSELLGPEYFPDPSGITWAAPNGNPVHGWLFEPANPGYTGPGLPPAIVRIHGGPTSAASLRYNAEIAYFTSRGYAALAVNYRGSSGYGRAYRDALHLGWGEVDVEDAAGGARAAGALGKVDPGRLAILGGSAGGFTVLNALIRHPDLFKAGICLYGVSDLFRLALETHKIEAHYTDWLVGPFPGAEERYRARSPVFQASQIHTPLAIFQGADDRAVPPAQSEMIAAALRHNGVPHLYRLYEGEGHGFRKRETIADFLEQSERFLQQHLLFAA